VPSVVTTQSSVLPSRLLAEAILLTLVVSSSLETLLASSLLLPVVAAKARAQLTPQSPHAPSPSFPSVR